MRSKIMEIYEKYLMKEMDDSLFDEWETVKSVLESECRPFLKEAIGASNLLLEGVNPSEAPNTLKKKSVKKVKKDDVDNEVAKISKKLFGWDIRDGVFTTTSYDNARYGGQPVIVVPIGKFKYAWAQDIGAFYDTYDAWGDDDTWEKKMEQALKKYHTNNLKRYLSTVRSGECIINCNNYYRVNYKFNDLIIDYLGGNKNASNKPKMKVRKTGVIKKIFKDITGEFQI
jgi:hypothetical protein